MIRAVLDTNVLASAAISQPGTTINRIISAVRRATFQLVLSEAILIELHRTLANPYYTSRISPADAVRYELYLLRMATRISITTPVAGVATHPEDDPILATAVSARADYLVTGDQPLRGLGSIENIPIISPADFVTILDREH